MALAAKGRNAGEQGESGAGGITTQETRYHYAYRRIGGRALLWGICSVWGEHPIARSAGCGIDNDETTLTRLGGESCGTTRSGPSGAARFFGGAIRLMAAGCLHSIKRLGAAEPAPVEGV